MPEYDLDFLTTIPADEQPKFDAKKLFEELDVSKTQYEKLIESMYADPSPKGWLWEALYQKLLKGEVKTVRSIIEKHPEHRLYLVSAIKKQCHMLCKRKELAAMEQLYPKGTVKNGRS